MRIAVFTKNRTNPAYEAARLGAARVAASFGAETIDFVPANPDDPVEQSRLIDEAMAAHVDAIVLAPVHPTRLDDALHRIESSSIPLFAFVNPAPVGTCISFVGSDDYRLGVALAMRLYRHLDGRGSVLLVSGPADSVTSIPRVQAFEDMAKEFPGIRIAGTCVGAYDRSRAREEIARWIAEAPPFDACLAANDAMALGALDALRAAGRSAMVCGVNAIPEAVAAIRDGGMLATADFDAMNMAALATECALRHLRGETVPAKVELPVQVVDRSNCHRWDLPFAQRRILTLEEVT